MLTGVYVTQQVAAARPGLHYRSESMCFHSGGLFLCGLGGSSISSSSCIGGCNDGIDKHIEKSEAEREEKLEE